MERNLHSSHIHINLPKLGLSNPHSVNNVNLNTLESARDNENKNSTPSLPTHAWHDRVAEICESCTSQLRQSADKRAVMASRCGQGGQIAALD